MENSKIEWTDHTFNPWIGCTKVHEGCRHCYAETLMDHRYGKAKWGPSGTRVVTSDANWRKPVQWNKTAEAAGVRAKVFCASLADVFEDRPELVNWREGLFDLIDSTPWLDWLLLTKRPQNIRTMWLAPNRGPYIRNWLKAFPTGYATEEQCEEGFRPNVWLGTSVSDQESADKQIPHLTECRDLSPVLFLSVEPLLGPVDLDFACERRDTSCIDWVIVGGESGTGARPMQTQWVQSLRDQCLDSETPFFFKQWGEFGAAQTRVGKAAAGRKLDGLEWSEFPVAPAPK